MQVGKAASMRVFVASLGTETNTFSPMPTSRASFESTLYAPPGKHPETPTLCSAPIVVLRRRALKENIELVEGTAAFAEPAGILSRSAYESLRDEIIGQLQGALPVNGVVLGLHGAMVAQGYDDCEGDLLSRVRQLVGPDCIVSAELDPHSHLTQSRFDAADILIAFKEFAHVDFVERAEELVELSLRAMRHEIKPVMRKFDCRMIEVLPTSREPMRSFVDKMMSLEHHSKLSSMSKLREHIPGSDPSVLSISCIHGFMASDVPEMGTQMLVVTDDNAAKADELAKELGFELFSFRGRTRPTFHTIDGALDRAIELGDVGTPGDADTPDLCRRPIVIADVWDNPGGGVAGDSTFIIQRCLERGIHGVAVATIWDPQAVILCHAAGEGSRLQLRFGGKTAPLTNSGAPIDALVVVRRIVKDATQSFGKSVVPLGDSALIELPCGKDGGLLKVILNTNRSQTFEPDAFSNMGCDPLSQRILIVKSTNHFYPAFAAIAKEVLYVDTGLTHGSPYPSNPAKTPYTKLKRDLWPIVADPHKCGAASVPWYSAPNAMLDIPSMSNTKRQRVTGTR